MTRILFVCHGNICRSPAAEILLRDMIARSGLSEEYTVSSAATTTEEIGNPVYPPMRRLLEARGLDCSGKTARKVRRSDYDSYDLIIGMDEENRWDLRRIFHGDPDGRIHNLLEYLGRGDESIPDPWYTRDFSGCLYVIEQACYALLETLKRRGLPGFLGLRRYPVSLFRNAPEDGLERLVRRKPGCTSRYPDRAPSSRHPFCSHSSLRGRAARSPSLRRPHRIRFSRL